MRKKVKNFNCCPPSWNYKFSVANVHSAKLKLEDLKILATSKEVTKLLKMGNCKYNGAPNINNFFFLATNMNTSNTFVGHLSYLHWS